MTSLRSLPIQANVLRVVDRFEAPQVEGPKRLFNQIDSFYPAQADTGDAPWKLVTRRYEQVQEWVDGVISVATENGDQLIVQNSTDDRYAGLFNADMDDTEGVLEHLNTEQASLFTGGRQWPRTKVWRVIGGYLLLHGQVARASRLVLDADEFYDPDHPGRWPPIPITIEIPSAAATLPTDEIALEGSVTNLGPPAGCGGCDLPGDATITEITSPTFGCDCTSISSILLEPNGCGPSQPLSVPLELAPGPLGDYVGWEWTGSGLTGNGGPIDLTFQVWYDVALDIWQSFLGVTSNDPVDGYCETYYWADDVDVSLSCAPNNPLAGTVTLEWTGTGCYIQVDF